MHDNCFRMNTFYENVINFSKFKAKDVVIMMNLKGENRQVLEFAERGYEI